MRILRPNPAKKWKVPVHLIETGAPFEYLDYTSNSLSDNEESRTPVDIYIHDPKQERYVIQKGYFEWQDNFIFEAILLPDGYYRGRSAAGFTFRDAQTGALMTMRLQKLSELIEAVAANDGRVVVTGGGFKGTYTFFKQGANYTIGLFVP